MDSDTIKLAVDGKYSEFCTAIKKELTVKLAQTDIAREYSEEFDRINMMKSQFAEISNPEA